MTQLSAQLRQLDVTVERFASLAMRTLLWPALYAIALGAAAWSFTHRELLPKISANKLSEAQRIEGLYYLAGACVALGLCYLTAMALWRWRQGSWQPLRVAGVANRALSFVLATPLLMGLLTPSISHKSPKATLFFIALAAASTLPSFMLLAETAESSREAGGWAARLSASGRYLAPLAVALMFIGYGYFFSNLAITNHQGFASRTIDLGYYDNIFYQSAHGRPLACSFLKTGNHVAAHFDPLLVLLSPLYLLYPRAESILVLQSVWLASGVVPAYLLARHLLGSRFAGVVMAAVYALHPALHGANMYEFHSLTLLAMPLMWAIYFLETGAHKRYWVTFVLLLLLREDIPLVMCFVGAYAILSRRPGAARLGWITIVASVAYFVMVKAVFMPSSQVLNAGKNSNGFGYYFREMIPNGKGIGGLVISLVSNPVFLVQHVLAEKKLVYLAKLMLPLGLLPFFAKRGRVMMFYGLLFLLSATRTAVFSTHFQYSMLILPVLIAITPMALKRFRDGRAGEILRVNGRILVAGLLGAILVSSALTSWKYGGIMDNPTFRGGFAKVRRELSPSQVKFYADFTKLAEMIEPGAGVTVTNRVGPHLSGRRHAYLYRQAKVAESDYVFVDEREIKGKRRAWHKRRIARGELELLGAVRTLKLYRYHPDWEKGDKAKKVKAEEEAAAKKKREAAAKKKGEAVDAAKPGKADGSAKAGSSAKADSSAKSKKARVRDGALGAGEGVEKVLGRKAGSRSSAQPKR